MRRVLLCGATGHLGRHVLKQLGAAGFPVRALVRSEAQAAELRGFVQEVTTGDLRQAGSLSDCCAAIDTVISTAGASVHLNTRGSHSFREVDLGGNRNLLEEAKRGGARKFVYVSALATPELLRTEYVRAKEEMAALVIASGLEYQVLRPTGFFSAFADLPGMARRGPLPLLGAGEAKTNPIDDEEVAAACVEAIDSGERERSIGGPEVLTRREIFDLVFAGLGKAPRYRRLPAGLVGAGGRAVRMFNRRLGDLAEFYAAVSRCDAVAPVYGTRRIGDYLTAVARYS